MDHALSKPNKLVLLWKRWGQCQLVDCYANIVACYANLFRCSRHPEAQVNMNSQNNLYNLLMSGNDQAWTGTSWIMEYGRMFEYTHAQVKQPFEALDDNALQALLGLPTLFAYEKYLSAPAHVGRITSINRRQREFAFTFAFDTSVAPIPHPVFMQLLHDLDIDPKWEVNRSHWAVKNVNLADVLHRAGLLATDALKPLRPPPKVFISYSWDSPEHRAWVTQLAMTLRQHGIEVILDQWHVRPGEDLANFMARSVRESDRILMICTETYVQKAQQRQGGVGYEQMLVTAQIMREVGTAKFIPIVRQTAHPRQLPDELAARLYVDLSDGPEQHGHLQHLIRDLHDLSVPLPPLGRPPF